EWQQQEKAKPRSQPSQIGQWLAVPLFIIVGCAFLVGGVSLIVSGHPLSIIFGLFFTGVGLILSVGLTWASVAVFLDWLRHRTYDARSVAADGTETARVETRPFVSRRLSQNRSPARRNAQQPSLSWTVPLEAILIVPAIVVALVFRFRMLPWDFG